MSNFVLVHYDDDISEVVPIGYVKNKEAENVRKHGKYKIAWCADINLKNQEPPEGVKYYKGVVLQLIDTLKEAQSIRSTRIAEVSAAGAKESAKTHGKMNFTDVGVQLQKKAWNNAMDPKIGASVAVKNLATSVWGSDVLLTRTVTGVPSNANKDKEPRPPLTPKKVAFLRECLIKKL